MRSLTMTHFTWSNVRSERWLGRTEFRPKDYMRTLVGDDEFVQPKRNETAPRSECRLTFKNTLTQPRLLEMDVKPASRTFDGVEVHLMSEYSCFHEFPLTRL